MIAFKIAPVPIPFDRFNQSLVFEEAAAVSHAFVLITPEHGLLSVFEGCAVLICPLAA